MDLVPLDPDLVRGTHGSRPKDEMDWPILFGHGIKGNQAIPATSVHEQLLNALK